MIKTIEVGGKPYEMKANIHIYEVYKNMFGKELATVINDTNKSLKQLIKVNDKGETIINEDVDSIPIVGMATIEALRIAWVMIRELNPNFEPLEEWEKELDDLSGSWMYEVLNLAYLPFRGRKLPQGHKQAGC